MKNPVIYIEDWNLVIPTYTEKVTEDWLGNIWSREEVETSREIYKIEDGKFILQFEQKTI